jgi:hypothetical protein
LSSFSLVRTARDVELIFANCDERGDEMANAEGLC